MLRRIAELVDANTIWPLACDTAMRLTEPKPVVLVSAVALVDVDGRVLIARRPEGKAMAGLWEFPGGKVHDGETPEAALIRELMTALDIEDPVVVGHSWGGAVTMRLAIDHGEDRTGLVLIAPALRSDVGEAAWYNRASRIPLIGPLITRVFVPILGPRQIDSGLETTFAPQPVPEDYAETVRINRLFNPSVFKANAADMAPVNEHLAAQEDYYSEVSLPTVMLAGPNDEVVYTNMHSARVVETMPNARLVTDEAWGHMLHHYAAERVRAAIDEVADGDLD